MITQLTLASHVALRAGPLGGMFLIKSTSPLIVSQQNQQSSSNLPVEQVPAP